jgi:hypothetical protein
MSRVGARLREVISNEHCIIESSVARNTKTTNHHASISCRSRAPHGGHPDEVLDIIIMEEFFDIEGVYAR